MNDQNTSHDSHAFGVCLALNLSGSLPSWIMLVPKGPKIVGNDGRSFVNSAPEKVVDAFRRHGRFAPIDVNHAEYHKAPRGEESPAAGWIEDLEIRDGAIWGRVDWTKTGAAALNARSYRYISPALQVDSAGNILSLVGAGLVNRPNLNMPALNQQETDMIPGKLLSALGLSADATEEQAVAAVGALKTQLNGADAPPISQYVPRGEYEIAVNAANAAQKKLEDIASTDRKAKGEALVDGAVKAGKITPASRDVFVKMCQSEEGLQHVEEFVRIQPTIFGVSTFDDTIRRYDAMGLNGTSQTPQEAEIFANMSIKAEDTAHPQGR